MTDFFGFPLSSLSSAHGLARGYFRNFVIPAVQGEVIDGPQDFQGVKSLVLECIIPTTVDHGTRGCVQDIVESGTITPVVLQAPGRQITSYAWSRTISSDPILVDVPTALGQLYDNIVSRLGPSSKVDRDATDFRDIEEDEISQFVRYLEGFKNKEHDSLGRRVRRYLRIIKVEDCRFPSLFSEI